MAFQLAILAKLSVDWLKSNKEILMSPCFRGSDGLFGGLASTSYKRNCFLDKYVILTLGMDLAKQGNVNLLDHE